MLKQFPFQLGEAGVASCFDILNLDITNGGPAIAITLTMSALFRASLLFNWLRLCQEQATCKQSQALAHSNSPRTVVLKLL